MYGTDDETPVESLRPNQLQSKYTVGIVFEFDFNARWLERERSMLHKSKKEMFDDEYIILEPDTNVILWQVIVNNDDGG